MNWYINGIQMKDLMNSGNEKFKIADPEWLTVVEVVEAVCMTLDMWES